MLSGFADITQQSRSTERPAWEDYAMNKKQLMILVTTLMLGLAANAGTGTLPQEPILASSGINNCHQICAWRCNGTQNQCYRSCRQYCR